MPRRLLALVAFLLAAPLEAQPLLPPGKAVRVRRTPAAETYDWTRTRRGRVVAARGDSLWVDVGGRSGTLAMAWRDVARLDTLSSGASRRLGVTVGATLGAALAVATTYVDLSGLGDGRPQDLGGDRVHVRERVLAGIVGATVGATLGSLLPGRRRWVRVRVSG